MNDELLPGSSPVDSGWGATLAESGLPPFVRLVGLTLVLHMSELGGWYWVEAETLADETGLTLRRVEDALAVLIEHGYIDRHRGELKPAA